MAGTEHEIVFKKETVSKVLSMFFKDEKTKLSSDAVSLMAEMLKIFAVEAIRRAIKQAENEGCDVVDLEHVEKILPELSLKVTEIHRDGLNGRLKLLDF